MTTKLALYRTFCWVPMLFSTTRIQIEAQRTLHDLQCMVVREPGLRGSIERLSSISKYLHRFTRYEKERLGGSCAN